MAKATKAMTKKQIIDHLAGKLDMPKKGVEVFLGELNDLVYAQTKKAKEFVFPGLGKFVLAQSKARMGRNPATGEAIKIPAKKTVKFRVAKQAKDTILK